MQTKYINSGSIIKNSTANAPKSIPTNTPDAFETITIKSYLTLTIQIINPITMMKYFVIDPNLSSGFYVQHLKQQLNILEIKGGIKTKS